MLEYLKAIAARLFRGGFNQFPPPDPVLGVREPRQNRPGGRDASAAVDEPRQLASVRAHGIDVSR
jgi:hypothetical protein